MVCFDLFGCEPGVDEASHFPRGVLWLGIANLLHSLMGLFFCSGIILVKISSWECETKNSWGLMSLF